MAFKINFDGSNNIFLITALTIPSVKEGIAVDALRVIFQNLYEAGERLESKLSAISNESIDLDSSKPDGYVTYSSIVGDTWVIVDGVRRLQLVLKHIPNIPHEINKELGEIFNRIKLIRDSFQHIDERIDLHFDNIGGSVFGELLWRFRQNLNEREVLYCIMSGVSRRPQHTDIETGPELEKFSQNVGIYDLSLVYISKDSKDKTSSKKRTTHSKVIVNIDEAVNCINSLIDHLEDRYSRFYESLDKTKNLEGSLPTSVRFRLKSEAFAKNNQK